MIADFISHWSQWMYSTSGQIILIFGLLATLSFSMKRLRPSILVILWALFFCKLLIGPEIAHPYSIRSLLERNINIQFRPVKLSLNQEITVDSEAIISSENTSHLLIYEQESLEIPYSELFFGIWSAGLLILLIRLLFQYQKSSHFIRKHGNAPPAELRVKMNILARKIGIQCPKCLLIPGNISPGVFGWFHPIILLPEDHCQYNEKELELALLHEMVHIKRKDTLQQGLQTLLTYLYWFHPLVWLAGHELRHHREMAVDEQVLLLESGIPRKVYEKTILNFTKNRYKQPVYGTLGILEPKNLIVRRVMKLMETKTKASTAGKISNWLLLAAITIFILPMGYSQYDSPSAPKVIKTIPKIGAMQVNPEIQQIEVYFDQPMQKGFSCTGGGDSFPEAAGKSYWKNSKTFIMPVKLKPNHSYRFGINSKSYRNFKSKKGVSSMPVLFTFQTSGNSAKEIVQQQQNYPPRVVKTIPEIGSNNVNPDLKNIVVTFNQDMGQGRSCTGGGPTFPKISDNVYWKNSRTFVMPVDLEPGKYYCFGLNSKSHRNFQSKAGQSLRPVVFSFQTRTKDGKAMAMPSAPIVVRTVPEIGAKNVPVTLKQIEVYFDQDMGGGRSCVGSSKTFPKVTGKFQWETPRKFVIPVELEKNRSYRFGLNSRSRKNFRSVKNTVLKPVLFTFDTEK